MPGTKASLISENGKKWKEFCGLCEGERRQWIGQKSQAWSPPLPSTGTPCFYSFHILGFWARFSVIRRVCSERKSDDHSASVKSTFCKWRGCDVRRVSNLVQRVRRSQPSVPHPAGAGQSGAEQAWEMFLFSEFKAQKKKSSQEKKKKGFIAQRGVFCFF